MATYYAGVGGNDANAGTSYALRKLTIQAAVNIATTAGDTVLVSPGTYRETVTMGTSGTAGNVISLIGDYTGQNTSGTKGVVRITGSNDDIAVTRTNCIVITGKSYLLIRGFRFDVATNGISLAGSGAADYGNITIDKCIGKDLNGNFLAGTHTTASWKYTNVTISNCYIGETKGSGVNLYVTTEVDACAITFENCVFVGCGTQGIICYLGGLLVHNCTFVGTQGNAVQLQGTGTAKGNVYNCIFSGCSAPANAALRAQTAATLTEDYNTFFACVTNRSNVTAGANSVTRPPLFDTRWFFEMVNGGRMVTPFDLASYSSLVEYNSGTGAPSTDIRGASVVGTYREWGATEFDSTLKIAAGGGVLRNPGMAGGINS